MDNKSPDAFRTISEVAEWLGVPTHVLRFWESRFTQVKPVKRAGGRRYYRPADMELLGGIRKLLHDDGMTIRGVQKLLREQGVKHVSAMSPPIDFDAIDATAGEDSDDNVVSLAARKAAEPEVEDAGIVEEPAQTPVDSALDSGASLADAPEGTLTRDDAAVADAHDQTVQDVAPDGLAVAEVSDLTADTQDGSAIMDGEAEPPLDTAPPSGEAAPADDPFGSEDAAAQFDLPEDASDPTTLFDDDRPDGTDNDAALGTQVTTTDDSDLVVAAEPDTPPETPQEQDAEITQTSRGYVEGLDADGPVTPKADPSDPDLPDPAPGRPDVPPTPEPDLPPVPEREPEPTPDRPDQPVPPAEPELPPAPALSMPDIGPDPQDNALALSRAPVAQRLRALRAAGTVIPAASLDALRDHLHSLRAGRSNGGDAAPRL